MSDDRKNTHMGQDFEAARDRWRDGYDKQLPNDKVRRNRSGIEVKPLYTPEDWSGDAYLPDLFVDAAPIDRSGDARRLQRADAPHCRFGRHRAQHDSV